MCKLKAKALLEYYLGEQAPQLADICGEKQITGFQLRDILEDNSELEKIKEALTKQISENKCTPNPQQPKIEEPKKTLPSIKEMLESIDLGEFYPKVVEEQLFLMHLLNDACYPGSTVAMKPD